MDCTKIYSKEQNNNNNNNKEKEKAFSNVNTKKTYPVGLSLYWQRTLDLCYHPLQMAVLKLILDLAGPDSRLGFQVWQVSPLTIQPASKETPDKQFCNITILDNKLIMTFHGLKDLLTHPIHSQHVEPS